MASGRTQPPAHAAPASRRHRSELSGLLLGIGAAAFIDEAVFHQVLHWHHFYDRSSSTAGLVSDGLFHALSWFATVGALFLLADVRRREGVLQRRWWSGFLVGLGGFQLYDGLVQHKAFRLHQIRYDVDLTPYDVAWNLVAVVVLLSGLLLYRRRERPDDSPV